MAKGLFISLEGEDKAGKSTQARLLAETLDGHGIPVVLTREPGGSPLGERLRGILLAAAAESAWAEVLLYAADRAEHVQRVIRPALAAGKVVVTDRYVDSSLAYQSYGLGLPLAEVAAVNRLATGGLKPDRTFLLRLDEEGLARRGLGSDGMEERGPGYRALVRQGFWELAAAEPERFRVLDAGSSPQELAKQIWAEVRSLWEEG